MSSPVMHGARGMNGIAKARHGSRAVGHPEGVAPLRPEADSTMSEHGPADEGKPCLNECEQNPNHLSKSSTIIDTHGTIDMTNAPDYSSLYNSNIFSKSYVCDTAEAVDTSSTGQGSM